MIGGTLTAPVSLQEHFLDYFDKKYISVCTSHTTCRYPPCSVRKKWTARPTAGYVSMKQLTSALYSKKGIGPLKSYSHVKWSFNVENLLVLAKDNELKWNNFVCKTIFINCKDVTILNSRKVVCILTSWKKWSTDP